MLDHDRCASDRGCDCGRMNCSSPKTLGDLQQHRSALQRHVTRTRFKTEIGFRPNARERVVFEQQFGARFDSRLQRDFVPHDVIQARRPYSRDRVHQLHVINKLGYLRLR